jgi:hypothetical protein
VRIGTWNLAGRWSDNHRDLLTEAACEVWLLTEVSERTAIPGYDLHGSVATCAPKRLWAAIATNGSMTPLPDPHPASAAARIAGMTFVCSVLPWRSARSGPVWVGDRHADKTVNAVNDLLLRLRAAPSLVWGGDWNHALVGKEYAGSKGGREAITSALDELKLVVPTAELPHAIDGLLSIDHVAVPAGVDATARRVVAECDGKRLSDHDAYVVDARQA